MKRPHDWTRQRIELLRVLWAKGERLIDIGAKLGGISGPCVSVKAKELGLRPPGEKPSAEPAERGCCYLHLVEGELRSCGARTSKRPADQGGGRHQYCDPHRDRTVPISGCNSRSRMAFTFDGRVR